MSENKEKEEQKEPRERIEKYKYAKLENLNLSAIPDELKIEERWMTWEAEPNPRGHKPRKRPVDYRSNRFCGYTDRKTWQTFGDARAFAEKHQKDGLMFILTPDCPYTGIDIDSCLDEKEQIISKQLKKAIVQFNTYTEISPSGTGLKLLIKGKVKHLHSHQTHHQLDDIKSLQDFEVYENKPWTFTGLKLENTPDTINDNPELLNRFYSKVFGANKYVPRRTTDNEELLDFDLNKGELLVLDNELIQAMTTIDSEPYEHWIRVGMALKDHGRRAGDEVARKMWRNWSIRAEKFNEHDLDYQWDHFNEVDDGLTIGTVFYLAKEAGYEFSTAYLQLLQKKKDENDTRPKVSLPFGETELRDTAKRLGRLMGETGTYYIRGNNLFTVIRKNNKDHLQIVDKEMFRSCVEDVARMGCYRPPKKDEGGKPIWEAKRISTNDSAAIMKAKVFVERIPEITIVVNCPVLVEKENQLSEIHGYDENTKIYARGKPTEEMDLKEACDLIKGIYCDYDFATPNDRSRAIAGLLSPAITLGKLLGLKRSPIDLIEADHPQSGKGLRVNIIARIYNETPTPVVQRNGGVGSWDESFGNAVLKGNPFIFVDNVRDRLSSQSLESFMTEQTAPIRPVGKQEIFVDPSRYCIFIASNSAKGERDLAQRVCITSIRKRPDNYDFKRFSEGDIEDHIFADQNRYLSAVHTVIKEWYRRGKKSKPVGIRNSFTRWFEVMEYILTEIMGEASVFEGVMEGIERLGSPLLPWVRELAIEVKRGGYMDEELSASAIIDIVEESGMEQGWVRHPYDLTDDAGRESAYKSLGIKFGKLFGDKEEIKIGDFSLKRIIAADEEYRSKKRYVFSELTAQNPPSAPKYPQVAPPTQKSIESGNPPTPPSHSTQLMIKEKKSVYSGMADCVGGFGGTWGVDDISGSAATTSNTPKSNAEKNPTWGHLGGLEPVENDVKSDIDELLGISETKPHLTDEEYDRAVKWHHDSVMRILDRLPPEDADENMRRILWDFARL